MKMTNASRKLIVTGCVLTIALILLITCASLKSLTRQQVFATAIGKAHRQLNEVHTTELTIYQLDIARIRYRRTGLNLFRLAFEQISDSLSTQIKELQYLTKDDSSQKICVASVSLGIKDLQAYWLLPANHSDTPGGKNKLRVAMEEETKIAEIQSDLNTISQTFTLRLKALLQADRKPLRQTQKVIIVSAVLLLAIQLSMIITTGRVSYRKRGKLM